jgi:hypothetical protein
MINLAILWTDFLGLVGCVFESSASFPFVELFVGHVWQTRPLHMFGLLDMLLGGTVGATT